MWRIGEKLFALGFLLSSLCWADKPGDTPRQILPCPTVQVAPRVDGRADDGAWQGLTGLTVDQLEHLHPNYREKWTGPDDLSATLRAVCTKTDLFLLIEVRDDVCMHEAGRPFWVGDSIELFLDTDLESDPDEKRYSDDDRQLFLLPFYDGVKWSVVSRGPGQPYPSGGLEDLELASRQVEGGYVVELRIPLGTLHPLRPNAAGEIGIDLALNDVDTPGADATESYITLSGRQDLYTDPTRFARLSIGEVGAAEERGTGSGGLPFSTTRILVGLAGVAALTLLVRRAAHRLSSQGRRPLFWLCGLSALGATVLASVPSTIAAIDAAWAPDRWESDLTSVHAAARAYLDLDDAPSDQRAHRLLRLLDRGVLPVRPKYRYQTVPLTSAAARAQPRYGIRLEPGESREFPLLALPAPAAIRARLSLPRKATRPTASAEAVRIELVLADGEQLASTASSDAFPVHLRLGDRREKPMDRVRIVNLLPFQPVLLDALVAVDDSGIESPLPLATRAPTGVPIDAWHDRPRTHIVRLARNEHRAIPVAGVAGKEISGHRLWIAGQALGAYPASPYGEDALSVRVIYEGGDAGPLLVLRNGIDLRNNTLLFALSDAERSRIAIEWVGRTNIPEALTMHSVAIDPARPIERLEFTDLGVLSAYRVAAVTIGDRTAAAPSVDSGLVLEDERLHIRDGLREHWNSLPIAVTVPSGRRIGSTTTDGATVSLPLTFETENDGALRVGLPRSGWAAMILARQDLFWGLAALFAAFATVLATGALLSRARHLRIKMLVAVGTATVVPLVFLVVGLTNRLNGAAEEELEKQTEIDLLRLAERVEAWRARAGAEAVRLRDTVEPIRMTGGTALAALLSRHASAARAEGMEIRIPGFEWDEPARFLNRNLIDATRSTGLTYSPWDGLLAMGVARAPGRRRYLVAAPPATLLGKAPSDGVIAALYTPGGVPMASTGPMPPRIPALATELGKDETSHYEAQSTLAGAWYSSAHFPLRSGGRVVAILGIFHPRAPTERTKNELLQVVLASALAALLLVVLAGSMLVEGVTTRLSRVNEAAQTLTRGDFGSRVPVESEDEVGVLAASFNSMADALDERVQQLSNLHAGLQRLSSARDQQAAARIGAELIQSATSASHVTVASFDPATERFETLHQLGSPAPIGATLPPSGPERNAIEQGEPCIAQGAIFLPLAAGDRVVGIAVASPVSADVDRAYIESTARPIGVALENARLFHAAVTDELTGLYTTSHFRRRLAEEVDHAADTSRPLSLLRIGLANADDIARTHGAQAAARIAAECAATLGDALPPRAIGAHRGDAEFWFLLAECGAEEAEKRLDGAIGSLQRQEFTWLSGAPVPQYHRNRVTFPEDGSSSAVLIDQLLRDAEPAPIAMREGLPTVRLPSPLEMVPGRSPAMRAVIEIVARVGPTTATVLLTGETGAGKEVIADLIHANSNRADAPIVKVNCAAIPESLVESELFGHEKGSFTGADRRRAGRFEAADGGALFLDEIGELPLPIQAKLLRVLQEKQFHRVGGTEAISVDVRIIAATNRNLAEAVRAGTFREDLFHRVNVVELRVPALRERREDIPQLIEHFRQRFNERHGLSVAAFRPDALDALYRYPWPGNVRQLRNVIERAMLMSGGPAVERAQIELPGVEPEAPVRKAPAGLTPRQERILDRARANGGVSNRELVESEDISARTALRELQLLVGRGLLERIGRRRGAVYRLTQG